MLLNRWGQIKTALRGFWLTKYSCVALFFVCLPLREPSDLPLLLLHSSANYGVSPFIAFLSQVIPVGHHHLNLFILLHLSLIVFSRLPASLTAFFVSPFHGLYLRHAWRRGRTSP